MPCNCSMTQAALIKCYGNLILKHSPTVLSLCFISYPAPFIRKGFRMSHALAFLIKMSTLGVFLHTQDSFLCFLPCARSWHHFCSVWTAAPCPTAAVQRCNLGQDLTQHRDGAWGNGMDLQTPLSFPTRDKLVQLKLPAALPVQVSSHTSELQSGTTEFDFQWLKDVMLWFNPAGSSAPQREQGRIGEKTVKFPLRRTSGSAHRGFHPS